MQLSISNITVEVIRKDIKNMHLRVQPPDGRVVLSTPRFVSDATIDGFVASKLAWIRRQQADIASQERQAQREGVTGESMYVWGKQCFLTVVEGAGYAIDIAGQEATFTVRTGSSAEQREAHMREWYREQLFAEVERLLPIWEERTGLKCAEWKTKYMKTRWGSCNPEARRIWLNVQLAKHPVECLEYVILHELAHFVEKSHGPKFIAVMDAYMPTWRSIRKELNDGMLDYIG